MSSESRADPIKPRLLALLREANTLDPHLAEDVRQNASFDALRAPPAFQSLLSPPTAPA